MSSLVIIPNPAALRAQLPTFSGGSRPQGGGASSSAIPARQDAAPPCACGLRNDAPYLPSSASPRSGETSRLAVSDAGRIRPPAVYRPFPLLNSQTPRLPAAKAIPVPMSSSAKSPVKHPFRGVCPSPRSIKRIHGRIFTECIQIHPTLFPYRITGNHRINSGE